jgi:hypothetical protein
MSDADIHPRSAVCEISRAGLGSASDECGWSGKKEAKPDPFAFGCRGGNESSEGAQASRAIAFFPGRAQWPGISTIWCIDADPKAEPTATSQGRWEEYNPRQGVAP